MLLIDLAEPKLHDWRIEDREYARQEERRRRRPACATLEPAATALVAVDMVPFFLTGFGYGLGIVPNVSALAAALRSAGGTVAWVVPGPTPPAGAAEVIGMTESAGRSG